MIRRDYIIRMIEEFMQMLSRLNSLKRNQQWNEADGALEAEFKKLIDSDAESALQLSEMELLARLMRGEPTQVIQQKRLMLATLFTEAGLVAEAQGRTAERRAFYIKALHLLLDTFGRGDDFEPPQFVPKVEWLANALADEPLSPATNAMLMEHYERVGEFAKAAHALEQIIASEADNPRALEFAAGFYRRLIAQSDAALKAGNLARAEVENSLSKLQSKLPGAT